MGETSKECQLSLRVSDLHELGRGGSILTLKSRGLIPNLQGRGSFGDCLSARKQGQITG
jgi:hypothetical protein